MQYVGGEIYLAINDLVGAGIKEITIRKGYARGSNLWQMVKDSADQRRVLVRWATMGENYRQMVVAHFGEPAVLIAATILEKNLVDGSVELEELRVYRIKGKALEANKLAEYAVACRWLKSIVEWKGRKAWWKYLGYGNAKAVWKAILMVIKAKRIKLPKNKSRLLAKVREFEQKGIGAVVHGHTGKSNRQRLTQIQKDLLVGLMNDEHGRKFAFTQVYDQFIALAKEQKWNNVLEPSVIHLNTVKTYLNQPSVRNIWWYGRHGAKAWSDTHEFVISRQRASEPNLQWQIDGTPLELWYWDGKKLGKVYVVTIMDAHSYYPVGYSISDTETGDSVVAALKMACVVNNTKPHELRYDKGSAMRKGEVQRIMSKLCDTHFATETGRARAKSVEGFIRHIKQQVTTYYYNVSGGNITAKTLESRNNEAKLKKYHKSFPNKQAVIGQVHEIYNVWKHLKGTDGRTPAERYADKQTNRRPFTLSDRVEAFHTWRCQGWGDKARLLTYKVTNVGIQMQVKGEIIKYIPVVDDLAAWMNENIGKRLVVKYDPLDLETIGLYEQVGDTMRFLEFANTKELVKEAVADMKVGDGATLQKFRGVQREQKRQIEDELSRVKSALDAENLLNGGITIRRVHKDAWNEAEIDLERQRLLGFADNVTVDSVLKEQRRELQMVGSNVEADGDVYDMDLDAMGIDLSDLLRVDD